MARLVITTAVLKQMIDNKALADEFPFVKHAANQFEPTPGRKKRCCGEKRRIAKSVVTTIKAGILGLNPERLVKFKSLLGVDVVEFSHIAKGSTKMHTL